MVSRDLPEMVRLLRSLSEFSEVEEANRGAFDESFSTFVMDLRDS
jgi:hypothetical protein